MAPHPPPSPVSYAKFIQCYHSAVPRQPKEQPEIPTTPTSAAVKQHIEGEAIKFGKNVCVRQSHASISH